jgi:hypothetical protein
VLDDGTKKEHKKRTISELKRGTATMIRLARHILEGAAFGTLMAVILAGQHLLQ